MRVAGIDYSTHALDMVTLPFDSDPSTDVSEHEVLRIPLDVRGEPGRAWINACRFTRAELLAAVDWEPIVICAVEFPVGLGRFRMLPLFGAIVASVPRPIPIIELAPQEWRRAFIGAGNASKLAAKGQAIRLGFPRDWSEDAYEALGICWAGRELNRRGIENAKTYS